MAQSLRVASCPKIIASTAYVGAITAFGAND